MVRRLNEKDKELVLSFIGTQPSINLFLIGDIEQFGFDKEFQDIWGKFDDKGNLKGVLLRYLNNFIPYYEDMDENLDEFKEIIKVYKGKKLISGKKDLLYKFEGILSDEKSRDTYFCELRDNKNLINYDESVKIATGNDAKKICDLLNTIEEFDTSEHNESIIRDRIEDKSGRTYYIEKDEDEIVTLSQTTAENSKSAMVVGVATRIGYRGRGYMSKCLSRLCNDLVSEGKSLCLFYDNPEAGKIYRKLGFKEIGIWTMKSGT